MKHEDKKHFDISKPHRYGPDPTSKPIIVGHHPTMPDPMIREEGVKVPKPINVSSEGDEPETLAVKQPELTDMSAPHETVPALTPSAPPTESVAPDVLESAPGAVFSPESAANPPATTDSTVPQSQPSPVITPEATTPQPPTPPEPPVHNEVHIPAGHGAVVHHKPRVWVWTLVVIIILAWAYAAVDALTDTDLPVEFFQNQTDDSVPTLGL